MCYNLSPSPSREIQVVLLLNKYVTIHEYRENYNTNADRQMRKTAIENGMPNPKVRKESMVTTSEKRAAQYLHWPFKRQGGEKRGAATNENRLSSMFYGGSSSYTPLALVYNFITHICGQNYEHNSIKSLPAIIFLYLRKNSRKNHAAVAILFRFALVISFRNAAPSRGLSNSKAQSRSSDTLMHAP